VTAPRLSHCAGDTRVGFFIAGVQKAGTTALARELAGSADIQMANGKETHFFDRERWKAGMDYGAYHEGWFQPRRPGAWLLGEATPIYLYWPGAMRAVRDYNPAAKVLVSLRRPAERAFSHWRMEVARGNETLSFGEAIREAGRGRIEGAESGAHPIFSYVERGFYARQIAGLLAIFARQQCHFLRMDELWLDRTGTLRAIGDFLEAELDVGTREPVRTVSVEGLAGQSISPKDAEYLDQLYRQEILDTGRMTGLDLSDWLEPGYGEPEALAGHAVAASDRRRTPSEPVGIVPMATSKIQPVKAGARTAVMVLGMHRSGTSALAKALTAAGLSAPLDPMPPQPDNIDGFCEPLGVVRLNNRILESVRSEWSTPGLFAIRGTLPSDRAEEIDAAVRERHIEAAVACIEQSFAGLDRIVLKDPRVCLFPELWEEALTRAGYAVKRALIHRNVFEVAESLKRRNGIGLHRAVQLWLRYNLRGAQASLDRPFDEVVSYPTLLVEGLPASLRQLALPPGGGAETESALRPELRHHVVTDETVERTGLLSVLAKRTARLLNEWESLDHHVRAKLIRDLSGDFEQACLFAGAITYLEPAFLEPPGPEERQAPPAVGEADERSVILHYHLFKNAGTSVDAILKENFPGRWASQEYGSSDHAQQLLELEILARQRPEVVAISSHTLTLPPPAFEGVRPLPIIFVRHPMDRLRSAYEFEVRQTDETDGSRLAKSTDFAGYLKARLSWPGDRACRNFQTMRFAQWLAPNDGEELERALRAVRELPFVGLVEAFEESMRRFADIASPLFPSFRPFEARANVSRDASASLEQRLQAIREELGPLHAAVEEANAADLALWRAVAAAYDRDPSQTNAE
jgi:hypothetical protein